MLRNSSPKMRSGGLACVLSLGLVWGGESGNPAIFERVAIDLACADDAKTQACGTSDNSVDTSQDEHVCSIVYWSKIFAPQLTQFKSDTGEMIFSDNGELQNREAIIEKICSLGDIEPTSRSDAVKITVDDLMNALGTALALESNKQYQEEWETTIAPGLKELFRRMDGVIRNAFDVMESDRIPQIRTRIVETVRILQDLHVVSSTAPYEVFKETLFSLLVDIYNSHKSLAPFCGQIRQFPDHIHPLINNMNEAMTDFLCMLAFGSENGHGKALYRKLDAFLDAARELICNTTTKDMLLACAHPQCGGSYNSLSEENKRLVFQCFKRVNALISFSRLIATCLRIHASTDDVIPEEMENVCKDICTGLLFLAAPYKSDKIGHKPISTLA